MLPEVSANKKALVVPSGEVNALVDPVVKDILSCVHGEPMFNSLLLANRFVAAGSTKSAGHPVTPPLV